MERRKSGEEGGQEGMTRSVLQCTNQESGFSAYIYKAGVDVICSFHSSWPKPDSSKVVCMEDKYRSVGT